MKKVFKKMKLSIFKFGILNYRSHKHFSNEAFNKRRPFTEILLYKYSVGDLVHLFYKVYLFLTQIIDERNFFPLNFINSFSSLATLFFVFEITAWVNAVQVVCHFWIWSAFKLQPFHKSWYWDGFLVPSAVFEITVSCQWKPTENLF